MADNEVAPGSKLWTPGRVVATLVAIGIIATIGYTIFSGRYEVKKNPNLALPGNGVSEKAGPTPDFGIPTIDGRTIRLSDYQGKVLVVDFWATWCPPCRLETPQLVRIARENGPRGVEVIGLHIDDRGRSSPEAIRSFMQKYQIPYTVGMATDEMFTAYLGREDDTIPQTLVFGRDGKLVAHFSGYSESHSRKLDEAVDRALAGS